MAPEKFGIWIVEAKVGEGSFGIVYRCLDPFLKKQIAIKALKSHLLQPGDAAVVSDFFKEAELLAHFNHPAFTHIHYLNPDPPWIAMEFLEGETLEDLLRRKDQVTLERIVWLFRAVCDGLHYIHEQVEEKYRTIHRDLKPANVLLTRDNRVKIVDFGVAKAQIGEPTIVGIIKGTPLYMSPEHMAGTVDARSDLWSLAVILFEAMTGTRPYPDPDPGQAWTYAKLRRFEHAVLNERYAPLPATMPPFLKSALTPFFDQAFQVDKERRFQSALKFRAALDRVVVQVSDDADPGEVLLPPFSEADALLLEAGDFFDQGAYGKAREQYEKVLSLDPNNEEAHHWLLQIEDRLRESESIPVPVRPEKPPPSAADRQRLAAESALIRRLLTKPGVQVPEALQGGLRELLRRVDDGSEEDLESLQRDLGDATRGVAAALQGSVTQEAEGARSALRELEAIDPEAASTGREEVEHLALSGSSDQMVVLTATLAALRDVDRRARERVADATSWLHRAASGIASDLELLLVTYEENGKSMTPVLEGGKRALATLKASSSTQAPGSLRDALMAGAGAMDLLRSEAEAARLERRRERLRRSCAALGEALPDPLASAFGLLELRKATLKSAGEVLESMDPSRLDSVNRELEDLIEAIHRSEAALRIPAVKPSSAPPAVQAPSVGLPARPTDSTTPGGKPAGAAVPPPPGAKPERPIIAPPAEVKSSPPARPERVESRQVEVKPAIPAVPERPQPKPPRDKRPAPRVDQRDEKRVAAATGQKRVFWGIAAAATVVAGVLGVMILRNGQDETPLPVATEGALIVEAVPWGNLREVLDLESSKPVTLSPEATTPFRLSLPPGHYRITVTHPEFGEASVETDIRGGEVRTIGLQLPRFDVEKLLSEF